MTITLQDVQILLGLRVDGPAVVGPNVVGQGRIWATWPICCDELLGTHPDRDTVYHAPDEEEDVATFRMGSSQVLGNGRKSWISSSEWAEDKIRELPAGNTMTYKDEFDGLRMSQIIITPYTQEVLDTLSVQYQEGQEIWRARVPLISWKRAEWHLPNRVVRQFSGVPSTDIELMDQSFRRIDGRDRADQDWTVQYRDYLQIWEERRAYMVPITPLLGNRQSRTRSLSMVV
ncbi:serine/threonine-protein phosphatase 7 long form homolog [Dendrobium catenatum]|uniref:serine/threonine-protein phosphatase 7 long form homolog n=1 Tax=Dendrobium catenatum TaxID=906689 RepID=UPI0009F47828|nr:serine/threonine-protein phosphatase 7 long form homolog [Dendrobium catenatum]